MDPLKSNVNVELKDDQLTFSGDFCYICYEPDTNDSNKCISPCNCRGTVSKVHRSCLEHWFYVSQMTKCPMCTFQFETRRIRYSVLDSIKMWYTYNDEPIIKQLFKEITKFKTMLINLVATLTFTNLTIVVPTTTYYSYDITQMLCQGNYRACMKKCITFGTCVLKTFGLICTIYIPLRLMKSFANWYLFYRKGEKVVLVD